MKSNHVLRGKTILLINTGSPKKKFILKRLKQLELNVVVMNKEAYPWAQSYVDKWIITDNLNHTEALRDLDKFLVDNPEIKIDGVVTFWEDDVLLTSKIIEKYNFKGIPYSIAKNVRNKFAFREFCKANGLPVPQFKAVKTDEDFDEVIKNFKFPVVIKPAFGASSAFVVRIDDARQLRETYEFIKSSITANYESALNDGTQIFVEEFIDGDEVDIDILLQNGKIKFYTISDNFDKTKGQFFLDRGQSVPSSLSDEEQYSLISMAEESLEKLGILNGCIHYEAKITKTGPFPIEVNMRMGGDYVYSYIKDAWNVDLIENAVKIAVGEYLRFPKNMQPKRYVIGWDLDPEESGIVSELYIPDNITKDPNVEDFSVYKHVGDVVLTPPEGHETLGWITVSGDNFLDAQDNLKKVLSKIVYKVIEFDEESSLGKTIRRSSFAAARIKKEHLLKAAKLEKLKMFTKGDLKDVKIGVVGNMFEDTNSPIEASLKREIIDVSETLKSKGYNVTTFDANDIPRMIKDLQSANIDMFFNLASELRDSSYLATQLPTIFEMLNLPYAGSGTQASSLVKDKICFKKLLTYHEIPTAPWDYMYSAKDEINEKLKYPLIVKPSLCDDSVGITAHSIVKNEKELRTQAGSVINKYKCPVVIEEYIQGDEYCASILGNSDEEVQILPLSKTDFSKLPKTVPHIFTYEAKWQNSSEYSKLIRQYPSKNVGKKLEKLISEIALDTYNIFDCQDYATVQIRVDEDDNLYVLECNANPMLIRDGELAKVAHVANISYIELLEQIILSAINRYKNK